MKPRFITVAPSERLREFVSHYWLSLNNPDLIYPALPDGAVDLVIKARGASALSWVYGTTTTRTDIVLEQHSHYLGVRFRPGQSRHFINAAARELTDTCELSEGLLLFSLNDVLENVATEAVFHQLNQLLVGHVARLQPAHARIDDVIALIEASRGTVRVSEAAAMFGRSRRQFERVFLETVGVSAKVFSSITRFRHAAARIAQLSASLADIALESGYSDQSHMTHEFRRIAKIPPAQFASAHVAFLQDPPSLEPDNGLV